MEIVSFPLSKTELMEHMIETFKIIDDEDIVMFILNCIKDKRDLFVIFFMIENNILVEYPFALIIDNPSIFNIKNNYDLPYFKSFSNRKDILLNILQESNFLMDEITQEFIDEHYNRIIYICR